MYIELDHNLVAGKVENINEEVVLEGRKEEEGQDGPSEIAKHWRTDKSLLKKFLSLNNEYLSFPCISLLYFSSRCFILG